MEKEVAVLAKDKGFNTLVTNKYLTKGCYDTFSNIVSLSNSRSVVSASLGLGMVGVKNIAYINNIFEFFHIYDDCYKDVFLNLLICIDYNDLPNYMDFNIFETYSLKYNILNKKHPEVSFEDLLVHVYSKSKRSGVLVLRG